MSDNVLESIRKHYDSQFGLSVGSESGPGAIEILVYGPEVVGFTTAVSIGLSVAPIGALMPQELACSVRTEQAGAAIALIRSCLKLCLANGRGLVDDDVVANDEPLLADTAITGVLTGAHPYLPEAFNFVRNSKGISMINIVSIIPLNQEEIEFFRQEGVEDLQALLERANPDLLDVRRASSVTTNQTSREGP